MIIYSDSESSFRLSKVIATLILCIFSKCTLAEPIKVAVASNFKHPAQEIFAAYTETTGHNVRASYASTGKLFAHITHGAPFELFLAADSRTPLLAEQQGFATKGSRFTYALGSLAIWHPGLTAANGGPVLAFRDGQTLALANPKLAPYGKAAEQVLAHIEHPRLRFKKVYGQSIAQAFQFVASGSSELGLVAVSQLLAFKAPKHTWQTIPVAHYSPIKQQAVLLLKGQPNPAAVELFEFLKLAQAQSIILSYGYRLEAP